MEVRAAPTAGEGLAMPPSAVPASADNPENDVEVAAAFAAGGPLSRLLPG